MLGELRKHRHRETKAILSTGREVTDPQNTSTTSVPFQRCHLSGSEADLVLGTFISIAQTGADGQSCQESIDGDSNRR